MPTGPSQPLADAPRRSRLTGPVLPTTGLANVPDLFGDEPVTVVSDPSFEDDFGSYLQDEPGRLETSRSVSHGKAEFVPSFGMRDDDDEAPTTVHPFEGIDASPIVATETMTGRTIGFDPDDQPTVLREQDLSTDWGPVTALPETVITPMTVTHTAEVPPSETSSSSWMLWLTIVVVTLAIGALFLFVHLMRNVPSRRPAITQPRGPVVPSPTPAPLPQAPTLPTNK